MTYVDVHSIKGGIAPFDFYRHYLPDVVLKPYGWNGAGICPFHIDSNPGSFFVNTESGAFKCFSCGAKGDVIAFTMALHGLGFPDALAKLADEWWLP
jgi:DNA primase